MTTASRYDLLDVPIGARHGARVDGSTGFLHAPVRATRTGIFVYRLADGTISRELKHPEDVFDAASLASLERIVVTRGHPRSRSGDAVDVSTANVRALQIGHGGSQIRRERVLDEDHAVIDATVTSREDVDAIMGGEGGASMGYTAEIVEEPGVWNGQPYDRRHKNIRYNHLALRVNPRGGSTVRALLDEGDGESCTSTERREDTMTTTRIKIRDGLELEVEATTAPLILAELDRRDSIATSLRTELEAAKARATTLEAERDQARKDHGAEKTRADAAESKAKDAPNLGATMAAVLDVVGKARRFAPKLDAAAVSKVLDAKPADPCAALREAAVLMACADESESLKGKSAEYFAARFDGLVASAKDEDPTRTIADELAGARAPADERRRDDEDLKKRLDGALDPGDPLAFVDSKHIMGERPKRPEARA